MRATATLTPWGTAYRYPLGDELGESLDRADIRRAIADLRAFQSAAEIALNLHNEDPGE